MSSRLAVILVADVVGYSALMAADEKSAISVVRGINDKHLEPNVAGHSGEILKRLGDGWIISFGSILSAIDCALTTQEALTAEPKVKLRIGAHLGEIIEDDKDIYGAGINLASRLQAEAPPGGVMISQDLHHQLTGETGASFSEAGTFNLKNIPYPVIGFQWRPQRTGVSSSGELPTIYVERFKFPAGDDEASETAEELHEQMVTALSKRTGVKLITTLNAAEGEPTYTVKGRLRMAGSKGRLNISLERAGHDSPVFTHNYQSDTSDIFDFIDHMCHKVSADIRVQFNAYDADRISELADDELSVSELRSRAAGYYYKGTYRSWLRGRKLMDRALEMNPEDPIALAMRAEAEVMLSDARYDQLSPEEKGRIEADLATAVERAPNSDFVFFVRSHFGAMQLHDATGARRNARRALEIDPSYVLGTQALAYSHMMEGEFGEAEKLLRSAVKMTSNDPFLPQRLFQLALCLYCAKKCDDAIEHLDHAIQFSPNCRGLHILRALCADQTGQPDVAERSRAQAARLSGEPTVLTGRLRLPDEFDDLLTQLAPTEPPAV